MNQLLYLDAHILDICITFKDPLQAGHPYILFTSWPSFHKLLIHFFYIRMLDLGILQYPALPAFINSKEKLDNVFDVHDTQDHEF